MSRDVLRRNAGGAPRKSFVITARFIKGEFALWMRIEIRTVAVEREHGEEFRIHARRRNLRGPQPLDSRIERWAKLHESISPRRTRGQGEKQTRERRQLKDCFANDQRQPTALTPRPPSPASASLPDSARPARR